MQSPNSYNPDQPILNWLSDIEIPIGSSSVPAPSRLIKANKRPLSPPATQPQRRSSSKSSNKKREKYHRFMSEEDAEQTPKRRRIESLSSAERHVNSTPRARAPVILSATTTRSTSSIRSASSSPSKQLAALELDYYTSVRRKAFNLEDPDLPPSLLQLLVELDSCDRGIGVIDTSVRSDVHRLATEHISFRIINNFAYKGESGEEDGFEALHPQEAFRILHDAEEAQVAAFDEASWNMLVHWPVLNNAIFSRSRQKHSLVGVSPCTTATIIREYLPPTAKPKMVDFAIYVDPSTDYAACEAINDLRRSLPCQVINHSDFIPLNSRPIAVSIETKRRLSGVGNAELQLVTWHAAQWALLDSLLSRVEDSEDAARSSSKPTGLPFLPAILVNGHDWSFAATTRVGKRTTFWSDKHFGSTASIQGIYSIVWGLRRLQRWTAKVFWPWYRAEVLKLESSRDF